MLSGCASTVVDAQWHSIELPAAYLRGVPVLVVCEARERVLRQICERQVAADLGARGARPVLPAPGTVEAARPGSLDLQFLPAARGSGAKAVFSVSVALASQSVSPGVSLGIGSFFGLGRNVGGSIGVSAPIGGGRVSSGYGASARVTDVASSRLMWTARASAPPSSDVNGQLAELSNVLIEAADASGLF